MISVLGQCAACCTCTDGFARVPSAVVNVSCASLTAVPTLCGFSGYDDGSYDSGNPELWEGQGKKWTTRVFAGSLEFKDGTCAPGGVGGPARVSFTLSGDNLEECSGSTPGSSSARYDDLSYTCATPSSLVATYTNYARILGASSGIGDIVTVGYASTSATLTEFTVTGDEVLVTDRMWFGSATETLTIPDTVAAAIARATTPTAGTSCCAETGEITVGNLTEPESTVSITLGSSTSVTLTVTINGLPETEYVVRIRYSNTYDGDPTPDTYDTLPAVETDIYGVAEFDVDIPDPVPLATRCFVSAEIVTDEYEIYFPVPSVGSGTCLRAEWVERLIPEAGTTVSSVSVHSAGVYRPAVTLSAPPSGGTQAYAVAAMSSTGTVSSISILNPGSGYASAPTVTVESAINGGTSSTGWVATLTAGQVTAIGSGSAGDYRPALEFSGGGGADAAATCTLNAVGGIASVTVTAAGTDYSSEPTLTITPKIAAPTDADLLIHLGTEVAKCEAWDGITPGGYDPEDPDTWPFFGRTATTEGAEAANIRTFCDCGAC